MTQRPLFLITNDDGYSAPGIAALKAAAQPFGDVVVVAPLHNMSGASHSITLTRGMRVQQISDDTFAVDGSPVDCVLVGLRQILRRVPTWVLSGINRGPNLGDDTLYSGTVGAAMSGFIHGTKAMAVSLAAYDGPMFYDAAREVVVKLLQHSAIQQLAPHGVFNVNVPNRTYASIAGVKATNLGKRHYDQGFEVDVTDPQMLWYGKARPGHDGAVGSDSTEVERGFVTVSMLKPDYLATELTHHLQGSLLSLDQ